MNYTLVTNLKKKDEDRKIGRMVAETVNQYYMVERKLGGRLILWLNQNRSKQCKCKGKSVTLYPLSRDRKIFTNHRKIMKLLKPTTQHHEQVETNDLKGALLLQGYERIIQTRIAIRKFQGNAKQEETSVNRLYGRPGN